MLWLCDVRFDFLLRQPIEGEDINQIGSICHFKRALGLLKHRWQPSQPSNRYRSV